MSLTSLLFVVSFASPRDARSRAWALWMEQAPAFDSKRQWKEAAAAMEESIRLHRFTSGMQYQGLALYRMMAGDADGAFAALRKLVGAGWICYEDVMNFDAWPAALKNDPRWREIVAQLKRKRERMLREQDPLDLGLSFTAAPKLVRDWTFDSTFSDAEFVRRLQEFHAYAQPRRTGVWMLSTYRFQKSASAPLNVNYWVFIPKGYRADRRTPTLVYSYGGWFYAGNKRPWSIQENLIKNPLWSTVAKEGYVEIVPVGFNAIDGSTPEGVDAVRQILVDAKRILNLDDDRTYLMGHSNGGSLAYRTASLSATPYAAFLPLNGWPDPGIPMANFRNRPIFALSGEGDSIFANRDVRAIHDAFAPVASTWELQTVPGGEHEIEPYIDDWSQGLFARMAATRRQPFAPERVWEGRAPGGVDWLSVEALDLARSRATWHAPTMTPDVKTQGDGQGGSGPGPHEQNADCGMVRALYRNNAFTLQTSRVAKVALWINPAMVDLTRPVRVVVDGKEAFSGTVKIDRDLASERFLGTFDRTALPVAKIVINLPKP